MATTKKASTGKKAGAGAGKGATKAKGVAKETKTKTKTKPAATKGATAPRKAVPIKLSGGQQELLKKVKGAGAAGYEVARKAEQRSIDALVERKLLKKGAKNKATGKQCYLVSKAGEKHLTTAPAAAASTVSDPAPMSAPPVT
jgi:hypothetical protein